MTRRDEAPDENHAHARTTPVRTTPLQTVVRLSASLLGALVMALGIALAQHSLTGNTPISTIPSVLFESGRRGALPMVSLGTLTFALNAAFLAAEVVVLRRRFPLWQLMQLPLVVMLSVSVDFWMATLIPMLSNDTALARYLLLAVSIVLVALGIYLGLVGDTVMMPPDAFMRLMASRHGRTYGFVKVSFDVALLALGVAISWLLMGELVGIREGTVVSAVAVGLVVTVLERLLVRFAERMPQGATPITPLPVD